MFQPALLDGAPDERGWLPRRRYWQNIGSLPPAPRQDLCDGHATVQDKGYPHKLRFILFVCSFFQGLDEIL